MKLLRLTLIVLLLLGGTAGLLAVYLRSHGFSARAEPSRAEAFLARHARSFAIPSAARAESNPVKYSPEVLTEAMEHFADHCAVCHANDGGGKTLLARGMYPRPPDMRQPETQSLSDGEIYWAIHNGVRFTGMPAFGEDKPGTADEDSWKLVYFIRHLPKISADELQTMKRFNPVSPSELEEEQQIEKFLSGDDSAPEAAAHHH